MIGDFFEAVDRRVSHNNAALRRGGNVDIVRAYAKAAYNLTVLERADNIGCDLSVSNKQAIRLTSNGQYRLRRRLLSKLEFGINPRQLLLHRV